MFKYLHDKKHYEDLYDLQTIEDCLKWYWDMRTGLEKSKLELMKKEPDINFDEEVHKICSYSVNFIAINRYRHKKSTLDEWMKRDKRIQDFFNSND